MCLIAWRTAPASPWPLLLAANRDEFHAREALPLHRWSGARHLIIAGKDLVGGGTWLGLAVTRRGLRLAMLTNVRNGRAPAAGLDAPSRGLLVSGLLGADEPASVMLSRLAGSEDLPRMAGFNLVAIDLTAAAVSGSLEDPPVPSPVASRPPAAAGGSDSRPGWSIVTRYLSHPGPAVGPIQATGSRPFTRTAPHRIADGVHGLSNGALDAPWPKTRVLMAAITRAGQLRDAAAGAESREAVADRAEADRQVLGCLTDRRPAPTGDLPDTGIDPAREQWLSSPFIPGEHYGTRCSTLIAISAEGRFEVFERRYGHDGSVQGDTREAG